MLCMLCELDFLSRAVMATLGVQGQKWPFCSPEVSANIIVAMKDQ